MERLLNLLQEFYGENRKFSNDDGLLTMTNGVENLSGAYAQTYIISKQGGFIKWLVENDKIDIFHLDNYIAFHNDYRFVANRELRDKNVDEDHLLMLLSISDTPIEFLISILKNM